MILLDIILQPTPAITFRPIGGILDFYFFMGPTPSDVISQYTDLVGRPFMPPYWGLGFHLCRFGYKTLNETKRVMQRNIDAGIPLVGRKDFFLYVNFMTLMKSKLKLKFDTTNSIDLLILLEFLIYFIIINKELVQKIIMSFSFYN